MSNIETLAGWLREAQLAVVFTGAGISTESGIPDFRSPGGIWSQAQPVYFQEFLESAEARHEYWRQKSIAHADFVQAQPNVGHQVLAAWEQAGLIRGVITQNIDGLHQLAGSQRVLELHGTAREIACLDCEARFDPDPLVAFFLEQDRVPDCPDCGGRLKHATVSFGQTLPPDVLQMSFGLARQADLCLAMGSSLVVEPAASIPMTTVRSGGRLVIINRDPTGHDGDADLVIQDGIGKTLSAVQDALASESNGD